eukprot:1817158-Pleurochrysis_carterae.AAC.1
MHCGIAGQRGSKYAASVARNQSLVLWGTAVNNGEHRRALPLNRRRHRNGRAHCSRGHTTTIGARSSYPYKYATPAYNIASCISTHKSRVLCPFPLFNEAIRNTAYTVLAVVTNTMTKSSSSSHRLSRLAEQSLDRGGRPQPSDERYRLDPHPPPAARHSARRYARRHGRMTST